MIQITKMVKNLFMELENANPNGSNVVINNVYLMFLLFFLKRWKLRTSKFVLE